MVKEPQSRLSIYNTIWIACANSDYDEESVQSGGIDEKQLLLWEKYKEKEKNAKLL